MRVTEIRAWQLEVRLPAPMRSRGSPGFVEYFHTGSEQQRITAVEVHTDAGATGTTLLHGHAAEWIESTARPALAGRDPRAVRSCRQALAEASAPGAPELPPGVRGHVNRLEFACWDLLAQSAGMPLFRLLGGEDPSVDVYAGGGSLCWNPLPLLLEEAESLLERGFRALKVKIGHGPEEDAGIVRALRRCCGPGVRLMVDANRAYDPENALRLCRTLEEESVSWFEEPLTYDDPAAWIRLREATAVPLAGGEGFTRIAQAAEALREGIVSILQCDAGALPLEALLAIGSMAAERGTALTPHSCNSGIGFVVSCHLQRALPNREVQEFETFENPFLYSLFREPPALRDGRVRLPERPGLGIELDPAALKRFARA